MKIKEHWKDIQEHFKTSFKSSLHVSIASVNDQGNPSITPIGTLFLNDNYGAYYFEKFTTSLQNNENKKVCILGINSSKSFWIKSLLKVEFKKYPGLKIYGELGERRKATNKEIQLLQKRLNKTKLTKGNKYLWGDMDTIREIKIKSIEKVNIGKMTEKL